MAARRVPFRSLELTRAYILTSARATPRPYHPIVVPVTVRAFTPHPILSASPTPPTPPAPNPMGATETPDPRNQPPPSVHASQDPDSDAARHAAFLGEADSNDGHEAHRDAYGEPAPSLDAENSAYLGEADSDNAFEVQRDVEGRRYDPVDASQSAFLGEADSDDGFEGRRAAHPEEGDHGIIDASVSGDHGQSGEGDGEIEQTRP